jgi:hypothetical protein
MYPSLLLLNNGLDDRQWLSKHIPMATNTNAGCIVFYMAYAASKESRQLVFPKLLFQTFILILPCHLSLGLPSGISLGWSTKILYPFHPCHTYLIQLDLA